MNMHLRCTRKMHESVSELVFDLPFTLLYIFSHCAYFSYFKRYHRFYYNTLFQRQIYLRFQFFFLFFFVLTQTVERFSDDASIGIEYE